jgi:tetratricopeptide (TPR) repeat protein
MKSETNKDDCSMMANFEIAHDSITGRLRRLGKKSGTWKPKHSLAAFGLVLAMALVSAGCGVSSNKEVEQLKAKNAALEKKISELETLSPLQTQAEQQARQLAYREKFNQRRDLDRKKYTEEQLTEAENMYAAAESRLKSPESVESVNQMLQKFPGANRTGCLLLQLAQTTTGPESEKYFKDCIEKYNDCYYGDGVQVGALARFWLANYYNHTGENEKAEALYKEIKNNCSDALDHNGQFLTNRIK